MLPQTDEVWIIKNAQAVKMKNNKKKNAINIVTIKWISRSCWKFLREVR